MTLKQTLILLLVGSIAVGISGLTSNEVDALMEYAVTLSNGTFSITDEGDCYRIKVENPVVFWETASSYVSPSGLTRAVENIYSDPSEFVIDKVVNVVADTYYCTPQSYVGVATGGAQFFNQFESSCEDVLVVGLQFDECNGHPGKDGNYHYHIAPNPACFYDFSTGVHHVATVAGEEASLIGVALDGFAIYDSAMYEGVDRTADLDICGGFAPSGTDSYRYIAEYGADHVIPCLRAPVKDGWCCKCTDAAYTDPSQRPTGGCGRKGK